jgi:hypothetical protein
MATTARSFCELDLTPALELVMRPWPSTLCDHAARCPACALRMSALERLAARIEAPPEPAIAIVTALAARARKRQRSSRLVQAVLAPIRRTAAVAALGVGALFLGLVVGGGLTLGLAVVSDSGRLFHIGQAFASASSPALYDSSLRNAEEQARALAAHGSLIPLPLLP